MVADILPKWAGRACVEANEGCLTWRSPSLVEIPQPVQSQAATPFSSKKTEPKHIPAPGGRATASICSPASGLNPTSGARELRRR